LVDCRQAAVSFLSSDCPVYKTINHTPSLRTKRIDIGGQLLDAPSGASLLSTLL